MSCTSACGQLLRNVAVVWIAWGGWMGLAAEEPAVDFNRDVRPILSNKCFHCHGPDDAERHGGVNGLRLDNLEGAVEDLGNGTQAIVPGKSAQSVMLERVRSDDEFERMPPVDTGPGLSPDEIATLTRWIDQGAEYAEHWSYVPPVRPEVPEVRQSEWPANAVDHFILARLEAEGRAPAEQADRWTLARRVALDLTGLPPTWEEASSFVNDQAPDAYERFVDRMLAKPAFGEHWARMWLDLARYADSAGYADDPPRVIWAYRDWVIQAYNRNQPFDEFTIDQIAGDLLPEPTEDQRIATAFHRNTQTNNEGGTNDEEFRTVAVVDRVNTTYATWMGTTMACAQCHTHKYDPLTQDEYFASYAIFNNTADADRRNEAPVLSFFTDEQSRQRASWEAEAADLKEQLETLTPELARGLEAWDAAFPRDVAWRTPRPTRVKATSGRQGEVDESGVVRFAVDGDDQDTYTVALAPGAGPVAALRISALTDQGLPNQGPGLAGNGNFVLSRVEARLTPQQRAALVGRYVRVDLPGERRILALAEVEVFRDGENIATTGTAQQSSTDYDGHARLAIDGNTDGHYFNGQSVTHTATEADPWWQLDLGQMTPIERIVLWNRTDGSVGKRMAGYRVRVLDDEGRIVWETTQADAPDPSAEFTPDGVRPLTFSRAVADHNQSGFEAGGLATPGNPKYQGWAIGGGGKDAAVVLVLPEPVVVPEGMDLEVVLVHESSHERHVLGKFQIETTASAAVTQWLETPSQVVEALRVPADERTQPEQNRIQRYYLRQVAAELAPVRKRLEGLEKQLADMKPVTVPVMVELEADKRRTTRLQYRGNYLDTGHVVEPGLPAVFPPLPEGTEPNRLALARWLVSPENPLTARVTVNRFWEKLFGIGLVATSEEFGNQGELPSHPELLDWLAVEFVESGWDQKGLLKLLVMTSAYRQSAAVSREDFEDDPQNRLVGRGPRFRMTAEAIRDQALQVGGLLSSKMYGPPVRPPQPSFGLSAAFGGGIDWTTSEGEDRYRRGIYTTWRRSNPYPSMATFDAPNREVCIVRRDRTNTPLQALVTLNDPVFFEAAQALGRRIWAEGGGTTEDRVRYGLQICLVRPASDGEVARLSTLHADLIERLRGEPDKARHLATDPVGPLPEGADAVELAAWAVVGNVLLNLDEMFMSR